MCLLNKLQLSVLNTLAYYIKFYITLAYYTKVYVTLAYYTKLCIKL
jgi:hypothetical protein